MLRSDLQHQGKRKNLREHSEETAALLQASVACSAPTSPCNCAAIKCERTQGRKLPWGCECGVVSSECFCRCPVARGRLRVRSPPRRPSTAPQAAGRVWQGSGSVWPRRVGSGRGENIRRGISQPLASGGLISAEPVSCSFCGWAEAVNI